MNEDQILPEDQNIDDNELDGEAEIMAALQEIKNLSESEDEEFEDDNDEYTEEDEEIDSEEDEESDEFEEDEIDEEEEPETEKKVQSKEENAKFAEQRRQKQLQEKIDAEVAKLKQEAPEFALAKELSEMYGVAPDQLIEQIRENRLKEEAKQKNIPLEILKEREADRQRLSQVEEELNRVRFEQWENRIQSEASTLQTEFKMLTNDDIDQAVQYILQEVRNVNMPLEQAVYALHGKKIIESLAKDKVQDDLATQSGRKKKTPLAPNNGKPSKVKSLTAEERHIAKQFGMTEDDYLKYKS